MLLPENRELRKRWNQAIQINTKIRMDKLRCKALELLETYNNEYKATDIAYCKTVLSGVLAEDTAAARAKYLTPKQDEGEMSNEDQEEDGQSQGPDMKKFPKGRKLRVRKAHKSREMQEFKSEIIDLIQLQYEDMLKSLTAKLRVKILPSSNRKYTSRHSKDYRRT